MGIAKADILRLSVAERILLVEDIWDSIAESPDEVRLTPAQSRDLDVRLDDYHRNPEGGTPWQDVLEALRKRS
jgi:putative addiction module component (TIGR02574 family)